MLPLLRQCYESAVSARELAMSMKKGEVASLRLALSHTFDINLLMPHLNEVRRRFERLDCRLLRGTAAEVVELLKSGDAELGIRFRSRRRLGSPRSLAAVHRGLHPAGQCAASPCATGLRSRLQELRDERLLLRTYCEHAETTAALLRKSRPRCRPLLSDHLRERPDVHAGVGSGGSDRSEKHIEPRHLGAQSRSMDWS